MPADLRDQQAASIASCEETDLDTWRQYFANDGSCTYFHGPDWSCTWSTWQPAIYRPAPRLVRFADGSLAVLAITSQVTRSRSRRWHLSPAGTYGGWVSPSPLSPAHERALADRICAAPCFVWRRRPGEQPPTTAHGLRVGVDTTHGVDLTSGADAARAAWSASARRVARRAFDAGLTVAEAASHDDWMAYASVYDEISAERTVRTSYYPRSFFEALWATRSKASRLFLARWDDHLVGGALFFTHGDTAYGWHAVTTREVKGARQALEWRILDVLESEGFDFYDVGPSGGLPGVAAAKESMGASPYEAPILERPHRVQRLVSRVRSAHSKILP